MEEYQLTSIEIAQEAAHSRRYGKPKQLWRKDVLAMKWFCQACQEIQTPVSYCAFSTWFSRPVTHPIYLERDH